MEQGKIYITDQLQRLFAEAENVRENFQDEYLSVEHIIIASVSLQTDVGKILNNKGLTLNQVLEVVKKLGESKSDIT